MHNMFLGEKEKNNKTDFERKNALKSPRRRSYVLDYRPTIDKHGSRPEYEISAPPCGAIRVGYGYGERRRNVITLLLRRQP